MLSIYVFHRLDRRIIWAVLSLKFKLLNQLIVQNNVILMFMLNIYIKNNANRDLQFKLDANVKLFQT